VDSSRARLRFAEGGHARIPFDLRGQHIWMRGTINGSDSLWIVVDTGASSSVMDDSLARAFHLPFTSEHENHGAGGVQPGYTVDNITIGLPGLTIEKRHMDTTALASIARASDRTMQVIVGHELFAACIVRFDYAAGILDVWDAKKPPADLGGTPVPLTFVDNLPYVEGVLEVPGRPPVRGRFVIDSGSSGGLSLPAEVVERESLAAAVPRTLEGIARGVGGEKRNQVARAGAFSVGDLRFERPIMIFASPGPGRITALGTVGNLGGQLLSRCRVTFDYSRRQVRFEPAANFANPFETDMAGLALTRADSGFEVRVVNPETPASEAGLQPGDRITSIDGEPATQIAPAALRTRFQQEGREVRLEWLRGDQSMSATLKLRRLI
jgi:hypothetical protein